MFSTDATFVVHVKNVITLNKRKFILSPFPAISLLLSLCIQHTAWYVANSSFGTFWNFFFPLNIFNLWLVEPADVEGSGYGGLTV